MVTVWDTMPGTPTAKQAEKKMNAGMLANGFAGAEQVSAIGQARAASARESASRDSDAAAKNELTTGAAANEASWVARRTERLNEQAQHAAQKATMLIDELPKIARKAAQRAVTDVVSMAIGKMNEEVKATVGAAKSLEAASTRMAADQAQAAALPFQQAKLRSAQTMYSYAYQAQELAGVVGELKRKAVEIAQESLPLQARGNVVVAQQLQMQAHDLLDKALQMEAQARDFDRTANDINSKLGAYDSAADQAAEYAAHQANPNGEEAREIPQPPPPLTLPPDAYAAAGPAPGPAPAPASGAPAPAR
jgi:hypothetical protein